MCPRWNSFPAGFIPPCRNEMTHLTPKQFSSVPCPTCGVGLGERCLLHSGSPRLEPHLDRKLVAAEAIELHRSVETTRQIRQVKVHG